jgi:hypothetical protein
VSSAHHPPAPTHPLARPQNRTNAQDLEDELPGWAGQREDGMKMVTIRGFEALT